MSVTMAETSPRVLLLRRLSRMAQERCALSRRKRTRRCGPQCVSKMILKRCNLPSGCHCADARSTSRLPRELALLLSTRARLTLHGADVSYVAREAEEKLRLVRLRRFLCAACLNDNTTFPVFLAQGRVRDEAYGGAIFSTPQYSASTEPPACSRLDPYAPLSIVRVRRLHQIGRASCRERVWTAV